MNDWVKAIVTRDAVCAADDLVEHRLELRLHASESVGGFLRSVRRLGFLPPIAAGEATWALFTGRKPICVIAQQDEKIRYIADAHLSFGELPKAELFAARFRYYGQKDPELVQRKLSCGREIELA